MTRILIDDDLEVVRRGRRYHRQSVLYALAWGIGLLVVIGLAVTVPVMWITVPVLAFHTYDGYRSWQRTATVAALAPVPTECAVEATDEGLRFTHPVLAAPLFLPWTELRSFSIEPIVSVGRWQTMRFRHFAVHRLPGIGHPLDEPEVFLHASSDTAGPSGVAMASVDLGTQPPNVAILLVRPWDVRMAAPNGGAGWMPPVRLTTNGRSMSALAWWTFRDWATVTTPGLYLRIVDPEPLRKAMLEFGVREGFNCEDWAFATGQPHQDLVP